MGGGSKCGTERFTARDLAKEALQLVEKAPKDEAPKASALAWDSVRLQAGHHDVNNLGICSRPRSLKEVTEEALVSHRKLNDQSGEIGGVQRGFHARLMEQDGPNAFRSVCECMELAQRSQQKENWALLWSRYAGKHGQSSRKLELAKICSSENIPLESLSLSKSPDQWLKPEVSCGD
eukprot:Skav215203  [mRNA]  locus=scaffold2331:123353:124517:- [translate_table: standard]